MKINDLKLRKLLPPILYEIIFEGQHFIEYNLVCKKKPNSGETRSIKQSKDIHFLYYFCYFYTTKVKGRLFPLYDSFPTFLISTGNTGKDNFNINFRKIPFLDNKLCI